MELEKQGRYTLTVAYELFPEPLPVIYQGETEHFDEKYHSFNVEGKAMVLLLRETDIADIEGPHTVGTF